MSNNQRFTHILHKYQIFFYWSSIDRFAVRLAGSPCCFHGARSCRVSIAWCSSRIAGNNCCGRPLGQRCRSEDGLAMAMVGYGEESFRGHSLVADSDEFLNVFYWIIRKCVDSCAKNFGHWHHLGLVLEWFVKGGFEKKRQDLTQRGDETWDISVRLYRNVSHGLHRMPLPA